MTHQQDEEEEMNLNKSPSYSRRSSKSMPPCVVFRTDAAYHPGVVCILLFPIILLLVICTVTFKQGNHQQAWALLWSSILICFLYMLVLPKTFDVREDGMVGVKTILMTFKFSDIVRAYQTEVLSGEDFLRPKIKFGTSWSHLVVVLRRNGKMDMLCSPTETEQFIAAVEKVAAVLEQRETTKLSEEHGLKQDLSIQ